MVQMMDTDSATPKKGGNGDCTSAIATVQTVQHKKDFLAAFVACGNVSLTARQTGIGRQTHYDWLRLDPDYAAAWEEARAEALGVLEVEARRRAVEGTPRVKFHKGEPLIDPANGGPYVEREYSDVLLIFLLKAWDPDKYGDRATGHRQLNVNLINNAREAKPDIRGVGLVPEQREAMLRWRKMVKDENLLPGRGRIKSENGGATGGNGTNGDKPPVQTPRIPCAESVDL